MVILRERGKSEKAIENLECKNDMSVFSGEQKAEIGIAADIGTTTIAMTVADLKKGTVIGCLSETNCQTGLGADVMMRIMHAKAGKALELHQMVISQIEKMAEELLFQAGEDYTKASVLFAVVGNTTMCHLFLNKSVSGLAGYPFEAAYKGNYTCFGKEIGMKKFSQATVMVLSGIAAHVGSDALAVIGAEKLWQKDRIQLAVDLGTNAEIILNNRGEISVCSAAAGPALEGKGVRFGMRAVPGAVSGVKIASGNGNVILEYIAGEVPKGICGSGLIELTAELKKCGLLLTNGYLLEREEAEVQKLPKSLCDSLVYREGERAFLLYRGREKQHEIYLLQSDIRGIQLAKGAIQAGIIALLGESKISLEEVDELFVAGVLGSSVSCSNAVSIGLLPAVQSDFRFVGNAAGRGALLLLEHEEMAVWLAEIAKSVRHIELANLEKFQSLFLASMNLSSWK